MIENKTVALDFFIPTKRIAMKRIPDELILARMLADRPEQDTLTFCALEAVGNFENKYGMITTEVAAEVFGMTDIEAWGVMAGWDDLKYPESAPHWKGYAQKAPQNSKGASCLDKQLI